MIKEASFGKFKYLLYRPSEAVGLPLVVVLHGSGEIGSSLSKLKKREPYISLHNGKYAPNACVLIRCLKLRTPSSKSKKQRCSITIPSNALRIVYQLTRT